MGDVRNVAVLGPVSLYRVCDGTSNFDTKNCVGVCGHGVGSRHRGLAFDLMLDQLFPTI